MIDTSTMTPPQKAQALADFLEGAAFIAVRDQLAGFEADFPAGAAKGPLSSAGVVFKALAFTAPRQAADMNPSPSDPQA